MDRFLLKTQPGYPDREEEIPIQERFRDSDPYSSLESVASPEDITERQKTRREIHVSQLVREYITGIVR